MKNFILILLLASSVLVNAQKKPVAKTPAAQGKLTGVVTYETTRTGATPDFGSEVIIHRSDIPVASAQDTIYRFINVKLLKKIYKLTNENEYLQKLKDANADTPEKFLIIDEQTVAYFLRTMKSPESIVVIADANGNYSADLKPGRYEVIFRSKNRPGANSIMEINGQIDHHYVDIKPGVTETYNQRFR